MLIHSDKLIIGWKEQCGLPDLNIRKIIAKVDTGADTSAMHAINIKPFTDRGQPHIQFEVNPIRFNNTFSILCTAPVVDHRIIRSSNGQHEKRFVIITRLILGEREYLTQLTLTNRSLLNYRMLLGKEFLSGNVIIDTSEKFCQSKKKG
ncbi:MAG: RimK/LysX family protein [Gammaproteobacteria bacterium]|nr:RimK/LysX family protein [Gammaproteobacteria bacterium]